ncbi:probable phospholipase A2 homolog 1, partial [Triticum urartu]
HRRWRWRRRGPCCWWCSSCSPGAPRARQSRRRRRVAGRARRSTATRWGKLCGVGWSGCEGEDPCDDLDACCRDHDKCVEIKGLMSIKCHEKFKNCMRRVKKTGKVGFSKKCPYELAMATMTQGMDMAIMLSQLGSQKLEL